MSTSPRSFDSSAAVRRSQRLLASLPSTAASTDESSRLVLPEGCELVANAFVVFRWEDHPCVLQLNLSAHCWSRRRSGAIEHVLDKYGWRQSPQLHRVRSSSVDDAEWSRLKRILLVVLRLYDDKETGEMLGRIHWLNIIDCRLAYDMMRRECFYYHRHLYPAGSALGNHLKRCGVEVEDWYYSMSLTAADATSTTPAATADEPRTPPPLQRPELEVNSGSSAPDERQDDGALGPREWLSDIHIANLMFLLVYGQLSLPSEHRDHVQCMYPMNDQLFVQMLQRSEPGSLLSHATVGRGVTMVFINPSNNHWRLVVLDGRQRQVVLFDPLGSPLPMLIVQAVRAFVGASWRVLDLQHCLQAESWNCGIWAVLVASRYIVAAVSRLDRDDDAGAAMDVHEWLQPGNDFVLLDHAATAAQQATEQRLCWSGLRRQYGMPGWRKRRPRAGCCTHHLHQTMLEDAGLSDHADHVSYPRRLRPPSSKPVARCPPNRQRRFFSRSAAELIWIDLTDDVDTTESGSCEFRQELEQSYEDLADNYIEFREDNVNNQDAASLRYSLPAKFHSDVRCSSKLHGVP